jgi:hypothetical protein
MKSKKLVSSTIPVWLDVISVPVLSETIMVMISPSGTGYTARIPRQEACKRTHLGEGLKAWYRVPTPQRSCAYASPEASLLASQP